MAVTGVVGKPEVKKLGGAVEERLDYVGGEAAVAGDLIRINTSGEVVLAEINTAGAVHGITLYDVADDDAQAPVLLFAPDTVVSIPTIDTVAPEDLSKGTSYTLEKGTNGVWAVTSTTTNGVALVVSYADDGTPWSDRYGSFDQDSATDNNRVDVRFTAATLDAHVA
jgi:hypothetical protein